MSSTPRYLDELCPSASQDQRALPLDEYFGLMKVGTEGGLSTSLASEAEGAHIDDEGNVYSPYTKGDADFGLMKVGTEGGLSTSLASEAEGAHIDDEGNVYSPYTKGGE
ncbi:hypothetical protein Q3G72_017966 [Acer saccharum]|nr:hypothetical protein Q3G72_017966 [Acer saccharum]